MRPIIISADNLTFQKDSFLIITFSARRGAAGTLGLRGHRIYSSAELPASGSRNDVGRHARRRPVEQISRRSPEHRPTIGVLEPPQVTLCAFLEPAVSTAAKHRAASNPSGISKGIGPRGDRRLKWWADF